MVMNKEMEPNANHVVNSVNLNNEDKNANRDFNPTVLGREFVRQYYTMLNEGPQNLFRFYSDNSSLIHGNEPNETVIPAYGQDDINKKLMSLNFKDCHTKIRQVDSLETVNKSVVVQVIGELSNNGQPMRRFFQTFILAPRSPTHYYVRNDIFRYQDEVFFDDDEGYTEENLDDGNHVIEHTIDTTDAQTTVLNSSLVVNSSNNATTGLAIQTQQKSDKLNNGQLTEQPDKSVGISEERVSKFSCPEISPINTVSTNQNTNDLDDQLNNSGSEPSIDSPTLNNVDKATEDDEQAVDEKNENDNAALVQLTTPTTVEEKSVIAVQEPRTYATMVQRKFGQIGISSSAVISLDKKDGQLIKSNEESLVNTVLNNKKEKDLLSNEWAFESNNENNTTSTSSATTTSNHQESKSQRNGNQLSDEQQVFVGNLPVTIDENQLREYFIEYGEIVDVRICQKQGKTPNYGFITFNDAPVVKKILSKKPIYFNGHRINVEEKKSGRSFNSSSSGSFNRKDKEKDHLGNRNFSSSTGSGNQFSAFSNSTRVKEDRNRGFKDKDRKSANSNTGNRNNANSNFRR